MKIIKCLNIFSIDIYFVRVNDDKPYTKNNVQIPQVLIIKNVLYHYIYINTR